MLPPVIGGMQPTSLGIGDVEKREVIASAMEQGGAAVAVTTFGFVRYMDSAVLWLDDHHRAVTAVCAMVGVLVSIGGLLLSWYYKHQRLKRGLQDECES